jgi:predicted acyltransferase
MTANETRLVSLDVFRGVTMAAMVIVNNPGDWGNVYWPLLHADWHGWTPTDLVFPFFLFIVGISITLSKRTASWGSILRRTAIIFALGLFLAGYPRFNIERWRIPGVLQRIAICYLAAATIYRITSKRRGGSWKLGVNTAQASVVAGAALLLAFSYWAIMMLVPPPGGVAGDLTSEGTLGAWIDRALMQGHLWKSKWDP